MATLEIMHRSPFGKLINLSHNQPPEVQQMKVLKKLLTRARFTEFGQKYLFDQILMDADIRTSFQNLVPTYDYDKIYDEWWSRSREGISDVCWPGKVNFFALSSGTSGASSKYIPITRDLIRSNTLTSLRQLLSLAGYSNVPKKNVGKGWLMLGGSTELQKGPTYYAGDLSGIQAKNIPFWFQGMYKPGRKIARVRDWEEKLQEIVDKAPEWDISFIVGVPAWVQLCLEMIIQRYHLNTIHDIWPNLTFYVHGGVAFEPYKKGFCKLLGKPITYIETYLASEGFLAYQSRQYAKGMKLSLNNNIYFEFVPFNRENFDAEGRIVSEPRTLMIDDVKEGEDYALLISTNAGTWRYLIGDTIQFADLEKSEIIITGRTRHFLSMVGEHLSVDNMNKAIQIASESLNISIGEFTVAGIPYQGSFAHHWFVATNDPVNSEVLRASIDQSLKKLNDDYNVERQHALKDIFVDVLDEDVFIDFMKKKGRVGGQYKFPRVMKGALLDDWLSFIKLEKN